LDKHRKTSLTRRVLFCSPQYLGKLLIGDGSHKLVHDRNDVFREWIKGEEIPLIRGSYSNNENGENMWLYNGFNGAGCSIEDYRRTDLTLHQFFESRSRPDRLLVNEGVNGRNDFPYHRILKIAIAPATCFVPEELEEAIRPLGYNLSNSREMPGHEFPKSPNGH